MSSCEFAKNFRIPFLRHTSRTQPLFINYYQDQISKNLGRYLIFSKLRIIFVISNTYSFLQDIVPEQSYCIYLFMHGSCAALYLVKICNFMKVRVSEHQAVSPSSWNLITGALIT